MTRIIRQKLPAPPRRQENNIEINEIVFGTKIAYPFPPALFAVGDASC